jgi:glycosyltransferase involved in cell wall biosynthesis
MARLSGGRLAVAGEGPDRPRLERLAAARAPGRVHFHGWLPKARVLELVRSGTVLALPSRSQENQPLVVLEALASGVPVVGSALGGLPELVQPGRYGEVELRADEEWRGAMRAVDRVMVTALTWPLLLRYRYPLRAPRS